MNIKRYIPKRWKSFVFLSLFSCSSDLSDDAMPYVHFPDIVINLNLPQYNSLRTVGYQGINGGVRGIIIHRESPTTYHAVDRNCSYQPNNACASVDIHSSGLYLIDPCCGSSFNFDGTPTGSPAWRSLQKYQTKLDGSILTITDNIIQ
ncbi:hypothetical protein [Ohtaekwangia sp.]|uniref:hypothetical protein n=1 Tax=Ohtaekwangia sp. TaxID=2066019 RepID=UPI002F94D208